MRNKLHSASQALKGLLALREPISLPLSMALLPRAVILLGVGLSPRHPAMSSLLSGSAFLSSSAPVWPGARASLNVTRRAGRNSALTHYRSCRRSAGGEHWPLLGP